MTLHSVHVFLMRIFIHYRQKIWNYFLFSDFFYFVVWVGYFFIWFTFLQADIPFGELIHTQWQIETQKLKNNYFGPFFFIGRWSEFLLSHCQIAAISIRVFISDIMHNIVVYLPTRLVRSTEDKQSGDLV